MPFVVKPEDQRNDASILVTMPRDLRREAEQVAEERGLSLSAIGRQAFRLYFQGNGDGEGNGNGTHEELPG